MKDKCVEKVEYLLNHEKERLEIAAAGHRRTLRDHTFAQRAGQLDEMICDLLAGQAACGSRLFTAIKRSNHSRTYIHDEICN